MLEGKDLCERFSCSKILMTHMSTFFCMHFKLKKNYNYRTISSSFYLMCMSNNIWVIAMNITSTLQLFHFQPRVSSSSFCCCCKIKYKFNCNTSPCQSINRRWYFKFQWYFFEKTDTTHWLNENAYAQQ